MAVSKGSYKKNHNSQDQTKTRIILLNVETEKEEKIGNESIMSRLSNKSAEESKPAA